MLIIACILVVFGSNSVVLTEDVSVRSYNFTNKDIRLIGGNSELEGRVEIRINGTWGTICDARWFNSRVADVLCRMLHVNLSALDYFTDSRYGFGVGPIHYSGVYCDGTEQTIHNCSKYTALFCTHSSDVGLMCTGCSRSASNNFGLFEHVNITSNGDLYTGNCSNGASTFQFVYRCALNGSWEEYGPTCGPLDVRDVRFVGGVGRYDGGVEVLVGDTWGPVCGSSNVNGRYYYSFAPVFCKMKGLRYFTQFYTWGSNTINGFIANVQCPSNVDHVNSCSYTTVYTCYFQLFVVCEGFPLNISSIQLVDGSSAFDGRVELHVGDIIGTICPNDFEFVDAQVLCKMKGLNVSWFSIDYQYNTSGRYPLIRDLQCSGQESHINNCYYRTPYFAYPCDQGAVKLLCTECGTPDIFASWSVNYFHYNGTSLFANCEYKRTYIGYLRMICTANGWTTIEECQEYSYPLDIQEIRLVDGNSTFDGRVEIKVFNTWGTICHDHFEMEDANVICKMIGFNPAKGFRTSSIEGTGPVYVDNMACDANSSHINDCRYVTYDDCSHREDVAVTCTAKCDNPTLQWGMVNDTSTNVGSAISVACERGRILVGDSEIVCKEDGNWTSTPFCRLIDCGDPTPDNGEIMGTSYYLDDVVSVSCDTGYILSGDAVITCQNNSYWTDDPTCTIVVKNLYSYGKNHCRLIEIMCINNPEILLELK
ncbi:hypothetical protein DPMN_089478 [Dreissena polymorpha]|uniref:Uncharacterized protein n=1 Tax=Dreissena polymorpha TaxID=45954 RepID=A0A9D4KWG7_DREPO|nr:hypothetical protein DPMN_089478 [Dreissena polymorpha]